MAEEEDEGLVDIALLKNGAGLIADAFKAGAQVKEGAQKLVEGLALIIDGTFGDSAIDTDG